MCARFSLTSSPAEIEAYLGAEIEMELLPRANIAPTLDVPALIWHDGPQVALLRWGLVPYWSKDSVGTRFINARSETVLEKPAFREPFKKRRCVIPADGFYEWRDEPLESTLDFGLDSPKAGKTRKQPYFFHRAEGGMMGLAGLWDRWQSPGGETVESFTILTTEPNQTLESFHNRMPCILEPSEFETWIGPEDEPERLMALLQPVPDAALSCTAADPRLNNVRYEPFA